MSKYCEGYGFGDYTLIGCFVLVGLLLIFLSIGTIVVDMNGGLDTRINETDCYDKVGNKINNVTCTEQLTCAKNTWITLYPKCSVLEERSALKSEVKEK